MNWKIERVEGAGLDLEEVLDVYRTSGLGERRPIDDTARFREMLDNANLVLVARDNDTGKLIGIARSISDFSYVTYLSDIAVDGTYQRSGIGRALIDATQKETPGVKIVLLSAPSATEYYPHIGFTQHGSAWVLNP
ncbi:GNAT family N-acetyltransferase [Streptomyces sp. NPDC051211]|uniref:GNAT family N-acetyltransferase n=1 Tax=Streptomyces sp. NPDC051211 TaxID=3154643 RepID=UPI00344FD035